MLALAFRTATHNDPHPKPSASLNPKERQKLWPLSAESKLMFAVVFVLTAIMCGIGFFIFNYYANQIDAKYDETGKILAQTVAGQGQLALSNSNSSGVLLKTQLKRLAHAVLESTPDVAAIEFYDAKGQEVSVEVRSGLPKGVLISDYTAAIRQGNHPLGVVHVKLTGGIRAGLITSTKYFLILPFIGAWLFALLFTFCISYIWTKHLKVLVDGVRKVSSGEFGFQIPAQALWGQVQQLAFAFNDMSNRLKVYENQNIESLTFERNKLEAVLLSIADGVLVCDDQNRVVILNDTATQMLAIEHPQAFLGTELGDYISETEEAERLFQPVLKAFEASQQALDAPASAPFSHLLSLPEKSLRLLLSPIRDSGYNHLGFVMIMHDITKERAVDKLKTDFISNVSHELRTPVTTVKSYVDTLYFHRNELDADTFQEFMETVYVETERLKRLVNDILDFSRLDEGGVALERDWQDISPIVKLTVQSIRVLAEKKNLTLTTALESNLPPLYVNADAIERVLRNLLSNAIKYTPEGGKIKVKAEVSASGTGVEISVEDNGLGIPVEHLPRIFDRFYRVENKVHTVKGTGLGLHLVKITIEKHHEGRVFVHSKEGIGSIFGFELPLNPTETEEVVQDFF
jgi:signal transduction histidine kinase